MKPKRAATAIIVAPQKHSKLINKLPSYTAANSSQRGNFRILMVKRSSKSSWMKDLYVFPGGSVDENDFNSHGSLSLLTRSGRATPNWEGHGNGPLFHSFQNNSTSNSNINNTTPNNDNISPSHSHDLTKHQYHANEIAFAFRTAALREIFEESGILVSPSSSSLLSSSTSSTSQNHNSSPQFYPAIAPIDLDHHYNEELKQFPTKQQLFIPFTQLAYVLKIPIHEVFRRIVHLNDQDTLNSINASILDSTTADGVEADPQTPLGHATFLALCTSLGIAEAKCSSNNIPYTVFDTLTPIAKWISPPQEKKRFDTNFYLSILDPSQFGWNYPHVDNDTDPLDVAMSHFKSLSVQQLQEQEQEQTSSSSLDPTCKHAKKLLTSTLSNEISDISWISSNDILQRLDQVTFAPPTQYILSQLSGFTLAELEQLIQSPHDIDTLGFGFGYGVHTLFDEQHLIDQNKTNPTQQQRIHHPSLVPCCPERKTTLSLDPYSYYKAKELYQPSSLTQYTLSDQQKSNSHFNSSNISHIDGFTVNTKGHVLLPGDYENPLTSQLIIRVLSLLEQQSTISSSSTIHTTPIATPSSPFFDQYQTFSQLGSLGPLPTPSSVEQTGQPHSDDYLNIFTKVEEIEYIFNHQLLPALKLSNITQYSPPLHFFSKYPHLQQQQQPSPGNGNPDTTMLTKITNFMQTHPQHRDRISNLVHYHRVVDALTHNNWEIVVSNPKLIYKSREELLSEPIGAKL